MTTQTRWFLYGLGSALTLIFLVWVAWVTVTLRTVAFQAARGELAAQWIERQTNAVASRPVVQPPQAPTITAAPTPTEPPK